MNESLTTSGREGLVPDSPEWLNVLSDADKQSLKQITEDKSATKDERTVAQALMDVQHTVAAADKPKLEAIVKSDKASSSVKTLAEIILKLSHMPSESDKEKLKALAS